MEDKTLLFIQLSQVANRLLISNKTSMNTKYKYIFSLFFYIDILHFPTAVETEGLLNSRTLMLTQVCTCPQTWLQREPRSYANPLKTWYIKLNTIVIYVLKVDSLYYVNVH